MLATIMLDPHYKSLWVVENYMRHGDAICLASKYDMKKVIPLLVKFFERLNFFI
jgi:hypothetical protein